MNSIKVVYVEWVDSAAEVGWHSEVQERLGLTVSVGILVRETKDAIVLANSYDQDTEENNGRMYIPHCAIKKVRTLCQIQLKTKLKS